MPTDERPAEPLPIDLAANAESLGARVLRARTIADVREALAEARAASGPVVVHVEVDRYEGVPSYDSWWDVPVAEVAADESVREARRGVRARAPLAAPVRRAPSDPSVVAP